MYVRPVGIFGRNREKSGSGEVSKGRELRFPSHKVVNLHAQLKLSVTSRVSYELVGLEACSKT